jgi:iron complex outermembrane receptor protein
MKRRILPGVTVLVKGTKKAQQQISMVVIPSMLSGDVLQFSYVGLETKSVTVTGTTLNVTLTGSGETLQDVVVIGSRKPEQ